MAKRKVEVFLEEDLIKFATELGNGNRSNGIRLCVEYIENVITSGMMEKEDII